MSEKSPAVVATDVVKSYPVKGETEVVPALRGVSMTAWPGEVVAIMGPSGSGKSTLLYCLAGLERVDSGRVELLGKDLGSTPARQVAMMRRRSIGFVFQSLNLVPSMSAIDNVSLPLILAGTNARKCRNRAREKLEKVGLAGMGRREPQRMSGGQQQRVALARVFAQSPKIVFADEPTGALDRSAGSEMLDELVLLARRGACVVLVTHDLDAAARADRAIVLVDGRTVAELSQPTPAVLLEHIR